MELSSMKETTTDARYLIFIDNYVGIKILDELITRYKDYLPLVVTLPNSAAEKFCSKRKIESLAFFSEEQIINEIKNYAQCKVGILAWWPKIISKNLMKVTKTGFVNIHNSLLPNNKGKHPYFWALVEELPYGVTIHKVENGIDTGEILFQKEINYDWTDTGKTIYQRSLLEAEKLVLKNFEKFFCLEKINSKKNNGGTFHLGSELKTKSNIELDRSYSARELLNLIRARTFDVDSPSCFFYSDGQKYYVRVAIEKSD